MYSERVAQSEMGAYESLLTSEGDIIAGIIHFCATLGIYIKTSGKLRIGLHEGQQT